MFQFLFKYPWAAYQRGHIVLLGAWPAWALVALALAAAAGLAWLLRRPLRQPGAGRAAASLALQAALIALLLVLLWQPALSLDELNPEQNIVAVLVDDSSSMALPAAPGGAATREQAAVDALNGGLLRDLGRRFQVRLYTFDTQLRRVSSPAAMHPTGAATLVAANLRALLAQTSDLPLGAVVVLSDGADTGGGLDRGTLDQLASRHIALQTIAVGSAQAARDVELERVDLQRQAMEKARVRALAQVVAHGFAGQDARLTVRNGNQLLAAADFHVAGDGDTVTVPVMFNAGAAGAKTLTFAVTPLAGESSSANNERQRLLNVVSAPHRILYIEGEPRWEYKFIRRAESTDPQVQLVSMLRATENKIYRQGISDPSELADGFPSRPDEMFRYQGLIIGSVQAAYFTPAQQDLIEAFANRRGGGILFLGGEYALADGGWQDSPMQALLPVTLPDHAGTFVRADLTPGVTAQARAVLTEAGARSAITRLVDAPDANAKKWTQLPWLMDYQDAGTAKPGATTLAGVRSPQGRVTPLLVTENYGRGRTAVLATSGTWRWQMNLPLGDPTFTVFWQQLLHWLVAATPGPVTVNAAHTMLYDQGQITLQAEARDASYNPDPNAQLQLSVLGPNGARSTAALRPLPGSPGDFTASYDATQPGAYLATVTDAGGHSATVGFERIDGVAEAFDRQAHPDFLARLAEETGGENWKPSQAAALAAAVPYASAGLSTRQNLPLWNLPAAFLLLGGLALAEWLLRRRWGMV